MPQEPPQAAPQAPSPDTPKKFYLTTPIYYVNARPHIGHAYTTIVADVLARRHRLGGDDTFFLTGTDEHGQKIERSAAAAGIPPQQFADQVSGQFQDLWDRMGITYNRYIRTTDPAHKQGAQHLFRQLYNNGQIYLSTYTGQYSIGEEMFVDGPPGTLGPDGKPTETVTEENFFFRLSDFQLPLLDLIESNTLLITPDTARNEVLSFLRGNVYDAHEALNRGILADQPVIEGESWGETANRALNTSFPKEGTPRWNNAIGKTEKGFDYIPGALKDLSISRSSFTWGVPVPEDIQRDADATQPHVIYVWLDALANYITAIGYGSDSPVKQAEFQRYWPANLHLVGKEITRFHCVYWPAFLLALNPKLRHDPKGNPPSLTPEEHAEWAKNWLPKQITANGWLLFDNAKMSKSRGNVVRTETILDAFGTLCPPVHLTKDPNSNESNPEDTNSRGLASEPAPSGIEQASSPADSRAAASEPAPSEVEPASSLADRRGTASAVPSNPTEKAALAAEVRTPTPSERDLFAADVLRYFLLREIPFGQDGSFSFDALVTRYNADLANGYGNLVSRTLNLIAKTSDGVLEDCLEANSMVAYHSPLAKTGDRPAQDELVGISECQLFAWRLRELAEKSQSALENLNLSDALTTLSSSIRAVDSLLTSRKPWAATETDFSQTGRRSTLYTAAEAIRWLTALLYPVLPNATAKVWQQLGLGNIELAAESGELNNLEWGGLRPGTKLGPLTPIFPRADKSLIQVMLNMEEARTLIQEATNIPMTTEAALPTAKAGKSLAGEKMPTIPDAQTTTDPAAPPRTSSLDEPSGTLPVAGSTAQKPTLPSTPGPHTTAPASGLFAAQPNPDPQSPPPEITIDDFLKIDLRVAQILTAERIPKADKLLRLEVDLGPLGKRQILSGIAGHYAPEELLGRRIAVVANLAPRKMRGLDSHGMLLAASNPEDGPSGKPILATFTDDIPLGSRVR